ncbi:hypothetical protein SUGI_0537080 [Cryptomeria japonica]|nr:hypothetical protein SUGI_0537080 [Cryptomeria japonica]
MAFEQSLRRPVAATIRMIVPAGGAKPAPPVGPALGQYRLNLMTFCKDFNARTQHIKPETPMSVLLTAYKDNTFDFIVKSPSVTWYLKKAAGIQAGSDYAAGVHLNIYFKAERGPNLLDRLCHA